MKRHIRWWIAIGVGIVLVTVGVQWRRRQSQAPVFRTVQVARGDLQVTVLATGTVQPQNRLEIKPPIPGRVEDILVEEGQSVTTGEVLVRMSSTERAALMDAAGAKGPAEMAHWEELYKTTPLVAPIDGMVIARNMEPGQTVTAADAILVLSDRLIIKTQVDETDIGQIRLGQPTQITLDAYPSQGIDGTVDHIAYEARTVNNVTIYEVDVLPGRIPDVMRSGMTANVTFVVDAKHAVLTLPAEAVRQEHGRSTVLVKDQAHHRRRPATVTTGLTDGKRVEIVSGLADGDAVLVAALRAPTGNKSAAPSSPFSPMGRPRQGGRTSP